MAALLVPAVAQGAPHVRIRDVRIRKAQGFSNDRFDSSKPGEAYVEAMELLTVTIPI